MSDPAEDDIVQVMEITGLAGDRELVVSALKSNSGSVENVINEFFNDAEGFRKKYNPGWDEGMFCTGRDGSQNDTGISFHVEAPDEPTNDVIYGIEPPSSRQAAAPSRPPSRTNNRSPMGKAVDWTGAAVQAPSSRNQEDEDMQRALRESAQEAGIAVPEQETGVVGSSTTAPYFGPANRDHYDASQWAMVAPGAAQTTTQRIEGASQRKRADGAPAFLVNSFTGQGHHRLGALLTILHEIPLARNILLQCGTPSDSYGHNSQWWAGQEIVPPHVLAQVNSGELEWGERPEGPSFDHELHRLMAFLDSTERSYGSAEVMANMIPSAYADIEKSFYETLAERDGEVTAPFFTDVMITRADGSGEDTLHEKQAFGLLESYTLRPDYESITTLYEMLDHLMWGDLLNWGDPNSEARMAVFRDMGEMLAINLTGEGPAKSIDIPEEFYPERWLESRKEEAWRIQLGWRETKDAAARIQAAKTKLEQYVDDDGTAKDRKQQIFQAKEGFRGYTDYLDSRGRFRAAREEGFDVNKYPDYHTAPPQMTDEEKNLHDQSQHAVDFAEELLDQGRSKMEELSNELERIRDKQQFLGSLLTIPDKSGRPKPMTCKRFLLQGVATSPDVVYVCRRGKADLIELDGEEEEEETSQWWRLAYTPGDEMLPVAADTMTWPQVRHTMWKETKTPFLLYATEKAIHAERVPLSSSLERFVKADNKAFRQELHQETSTSTWGESGTPGITSPSKRKHRADSMDSMASNRASIASSDVGKLDDPFVDTSGGENQTQQAWLDGNQSREEMVLDHGDKAPPLPTRPPVSTGDTSTTLTPNTVGAGDGESPVSGATQQTTPPGGEMAADSDLTMVTVKETKGPDTKGSEAKGPEMQERSQMPSLFLSRENSGKSKQDGASAMDIDS